MVGIIVAVLALVLVVTYVGRGSPGTVTTILSGQKTVRSAWVTINEAGVTEAGPYDFKARVGSFETAGRYHGVSYVHGYVTYMPAALLWHEMNTPPANPPLPRPSKPWVSEDVEVIGGPMGNILLGNPLGPTPEQIANALQHQMVSVTLVTVGRLGSSPIHEYRLVLQPGPSLGKYLVSSRGAVEALGPHHPVLIWADNHHRLVQLSTSMAFNNPAQTITITLTYSQFDLPLVVHLPSPREVETLSQYHAEIEKAWGCPAKGGLCKGSGVMSSPVG
ncbi:MAG TPA: hypothetical protein VME46_15695 [Acidimicrobiales bacterium]|nr:hypothetical protein [Acidimicrobiales bacterium]